MKYGSGSIFVKMSDVFYEASIGYMCVILSLINFLKWWYLIAKYFVLGVILSGLATAMQLALSLKKVVNVLFVLASTG